MMAKEKTTIKMVIPIVPKAQRRARAGNGRVFKDPRQKAEERTIEAFLVEHRPGSPLDGPVSLVVNAMLPIPKSWSKKKAMAKSGEIWPTGRPDLDNITKNIKDCLTRMRFWEDDNQVVLLNARKSYAENPRWEVEVKEVE